MTLPSFDEIVIPNDQTEARSEHLARFIELVGNAYPSKFERSRLSGKEDTISELKAFSAVADVAKEMDEVRAALEPGTRPPAEIKDRLNETLKALGIVRIAGRIATPIRGNFVHLTDGREKLQIYAKKGQFTLARNDGQADREPEEAWEAWQILDHGDLIGVEGYLFVTNTGEVSVHVERLYFLSKALSPMPDKMHGIEDAEIKQRQRYLDLIASSLLQKQEARSQKQESEPPVPERGRPRPQTSEPPASTDGQSLQKPARSKGTTDQPESCNGRELTTREVFETRAKTISSLRRFLEDDGYIEVETPMLTPKATGAAAKPFKTHHNALDIDLYARIAPELYLKRLLVGGFEKVYELNRNFRNEGISYKHNPEFTMLEFYCAYMDVNGMMDFCERLIQESVRQATGGSLDVLVTNTDPRIAGIGSSYEARIDFSSFRKMSLEETVIASLPSLMDWYFKNVHQGLAIAISEWLAEQIGVDYASWFATSSNSTILLEWLDWLSSFDNLMNEVVEFDEHDAEQDIPDDVAIGSIKNRLSVIAHQHSGVDIDADQLTTNILRIFNDHIEKVAGVFNFPTGAVVNPIFVTDYPKSISPLSKASPTNPQIAERFELFINGMEVANGFSELNDPREQYERFRDQAEARERGDDEAMVLDEDYVRALSYGMPPAAGIGIGIDRLVMLLTNKHSIRDVILFPHMRPERRAEETEQEVSE